MDITTLLFTMAYILMADGKPQSFIPRDRQYNQNEDASNEFGDHLAIDVKDDNKTIDIDVGNALENLLYDLQNMNLDNNTQTIGDSPISNDFDNENLEHDEMPESMFASGTIENLISIADSDEDINAEVDVDDELDDEPFTVAERVENLISITDSDEDNNNAEVDADDELDDGPFTVAERVDDAAANHIPNAEIEDTALSQKHKSMLIGRTTSNPSTNSIDSIISNADVDGIELSEKHKSMIGRTTANPASIYIDGTDFDNTIAEPISDTDVVGIVIATPEQIANTGVEGIDIAVDGIAATEPLFDNNEDSIDIAYLESILDANIDVIDNTTTDLISDAISETAELISDSEFNGFELSEKHKSMLIISGTTNLTANSDDIDTTTKEPILDSYSDSIELSEKHKSVMKGSIIENPDPNSEDDIDSIFVQPISEIANSDDINTTTVEPISDSDIDGIELSEKHKSMLIESTSKSVNDTTTEERILDAADPPGPGGPLVPGAGGSEMNPVGPGNPPADGAGIVPQTPPIVNFAAVTNYSASAPGDEVCEGKYARGTETGRCVFPFEYAGQSHCDCLPRIFVVFDLPWTWCPTTVTNGVIDAWDHCIDTYTVRGSKCIFPFVSDNDEYNDCANSTDKPYCATSLRTDGITVDTWDVCADAWTEK